MTDRPLVDTGPLVALLNPRDRYHQWARAMFEQITSPVWTCEPVVTEACFLLRDTVPGVLAVLELLRRGVLQVPFRLDEEAEVIQASLKRYASVPMSLADACLVRMVEQYPSSRLLTLDRHFRIYRTRDRRVIPTAMPPDQAS